MRRILSHLGFMMAGSGPIVKVAVPSWRTDVQGKADIVEEIVRIVGVDKVPMTPFERGDAPRRARVGRPPPTIRPRALKLTTSYGSTMRGRQRALARRNWCGFKPRELSAGPAIPARCIATLERVIGNLSTPDDAPQLLDDVGLPLHVRAPGGTATFTMGPLPAIMKPRWLRMRLISTSGTSIAARRLTFGDREIDHAVFTESVADDDVLPTVGRRTAPSPVWSRVRAPAHERRIDAALEAIARIRIDAELAAGLGDVDSFHKRGFDSVRLSCSRRSRRLRRP